MEADEHICPACEGAGLLMDDEFWHYTCSVCGGDGVIDPEDLQGRKEVIDVDEMKRTLE
ncbi:hypothetical protein EDD68_13223 [Melghiribacillus thermohalophilus]|uniref:Uncharacterized protein n=1 Tax=Melghiribacillus thermohalophilus TaxID=1324956 RepID=A0A4R3MU47_9BACI|nr:hypothetical protein [Melghiribacillus thermohalophilus]TCT17250.1 hypothetical protein EDD68_13223 [Melghiribacillus thermohalophilus]